MFIIELWDNFSVYLFCIQVSINCARSLQKMRDETMLPTGFSSYYLTIQADELVHTHIQMPSELYAFTNKICLCTHMHDGMIEGNSKIYIHSICTSFACTHFQRILIKFHMRKCYLQFGYGFNTSHIRAKSPIFFVIFRKNIYIYECWCHVAFKINTFLGIHFDSYRFMNNQSTLRNLCIFCYIMNLLEFMHRWMFVCN